MASAALLLRSSSFADRSLLSAAHDWNKLLLAMESRDSDSSLEVPFLKGWFIKVRPSYTNEYTSSYNLIRIALKEKRDKYKRRGSLLGGNNRRWFTIESIANPLDKSSSELALCYYKRSTDDERCGWLFLNDVVSVSQDVAARWITIEHPSRILRIQSPTPAQHRVWFSTLLKTCTNIRKDVLASPVASPDRNRRHSLPYFDAVSPMRKNSADPVASTPKDQLKFLRELTGGSIDDSDKENETTPTTLFGASNIETVSSPSSSRSSNMSREKISSNTASPPTMTKLDGKSGKSQPDFPAVKQTTNRIHEFIKNPSVESSETRGYAEAHAPATRPAAKDNFDMTALSNDVNGIHISTSFLKKNDSLAAINGPQKDLPKSQSFSSAQTGYSRSSSYQHFFDNDDAVLIPDENFVTDDWDE